MATLWSRELTRFFRQPTRILGLIAAPLLFWLFLGSGLGDSFKPASENANYLQYFFPGTVLMVVLFSAVFSNMSVIEDRREGFLQSVLVAPVSRTALVTGLVLGGATEAFLPGLFVLLLAPVAGFRFAPDQALLAAGVLFLISFSLTALGFAIAWWVDSTQGFHAILNLVLIPMWLLSGALFPASGASSWVQWVMWVNPLTYEVAALRRSLYRPGGIIPMDVASLGSSLAVSVLFCLAVMAAALVWAGRPSVKQLA